MTEEQDAIQDEQIEQQDGTTQDAQAEEEPALIQDEAVEEKPKPVLRVENLNKTYAIPNGKLTILQDIT